MKKRLEKILEDNFYNEPRIMDYETLIVANHQAIKRDYNRTINIVSFLSAVKSLGYDPKKVRFPVLPVMLHEHAGGKLTDPHVRLKVIGPSDLDEDVMVRAYLDCPMEIFNTLSVYDNDSRSILSVN